MLLFCYHMNILLGIVAKLTKAKKATKKNIKDYQQELLIKQGRDQIRQLLKFGQMPVTFL